MLTVLRIENLAIIDRLELELSPGLNALTGETGAGKSIIIGALGLVLGARASTDAIRHGADRGSVEALFDLSHRPDVRAALDDAGLPSDSDELLVRRVLTRAGRSRVYLNGALVTLSTLSRLVSPLVEVTGQHEQHGLLNPASHLAILDAFGGTSGERDVFATDYRALAALRRDLARLVADETDRAARQDYLAYQLAEIDHAELEPDEDATLEHERARLRNAEELRASADETEQILYEGRGAVVSELERARGLLARVSDLDATAPGLASRLEGARIELEDVVFELRTYRDGVEADPNRLQEVEDRLELIRTLARKHGPTVADILARRREIAAELGGIETAGERRGELERAVREGEAALLQRARGLSEQRREAATRLERAVHESLSALAMERSRLRVAFANEEDGPETLGESGVDRVELLVAANVGEGFKPLARVASGGELSRILLSLKRALTQSDSVATYVFDEVDAGIGGAVAETVGRLLAETGARHQVLVITHLPQVASYADRHLRVEKEERDGRTVTRLVSLSERERVEEIARMLGGMELTKRTRDHAAEMIDNARARSRP